MGADELCKCRYGCEQLTDCLEIIVDNTAVYLKVSKGLGLQITIHNNGNCLAAGSLPATFAGMMLKYLNESYTK